jgi:hypothetical protein
VRMRVPIAVAEGLVMRGPAGPQPKAAEPPICLPPNADAPAKSTIAPNGKMPPRPPRPFIASPLAMYARLTPESRRLEDEDRARGEAWVAAGGDVKEFGGG